MIKYELTIFFLLCFICIILFCVLLGCLLIYFGNKKQKKQIKNKNQKPNTKYQIPKNQEQ